MDSTTRRAGPGGDPGSPAAPHPVSDGSPPAGLRLVRWGMAIHAGLWALITLTFAVDLAADTAPPTAWKWLRLVLALSITALLASVGQRVGRGRPAAWFAALGMQVLAAAGYVLFTWSLLTGPQPGLTSAPLTLTIGGSVLLAALAGIVLWLGPAPRSYCIHTTR